MYNAATLVYLALFNLYTLTFIALTYTFLCITVCSKHCTYNSQGTIHHYSEYLKSTVFGLCL